LLNYPLSADRLEDHVKQMMLNLRYELPDGRKSATSLVACFIRRFPLELVEQHCQLLFLPLTLQMVNDESKDCREAAAACLLKLVERISVGSVQALYDYVQRWWKSKSESLERTSFQLTGIFLDARPDFMKRADVNDRVLNALRSVFNKSSDWSLQWENLFFALSCMEKMAVIYPRQTSIAVDLWPFVVASLTHHHPWIRRVSTRLLARHVSSLDPSRFASDTSDLDKRTKHKSVIDESVGSVTFINVITGSLFSLARQMCQQLSASDDAGYDPELVADATKIMTWIVKAMQSFPNLCLVADPGLEEDVFHRDDSGDDVDESVLSSERVPGDTGSKRNPVRWVLIRLCYLARQRNSFRRQFIYKIFAALTTYCADVVFPYLECLLEPLHRTEVEAQHDEEQGNSFGVHRPGTQGTADFASVTETTEVQLAKDVLRLIEDRCDDLSLGGNKFDFIECYRGVKLRAQMRKARREAVRVAQAASNPEYRAERSAKKHRAEKERRKKRIHGHQVPRGVVGKSTNGSNKRSRYHHNADG
jgi:U3 small nucleolar RNA-associated protein 20